MHFPNFLTNFAPLKTINIKYTTLMTLRYLGYALALSATLTASAQTHVMDIKTNKQGAPVQSAACMPRW